MPLGVLNNIAAMYAENNLNQTQNNLNNTLQQLSSGSRINSGSDDAAGLAVADGLQANEAALTQSSQNATSGVSELQTADGALSQVNNLLNRAVTLATEASNGTLNSSQVSAANQEYQNILSEIGNIGSTTNFNSNSVFSGNATDIVVSDGTSAGTTTFADTIGTLSASNVGESAGATSVTTTTPGVSTTLATPIATNSSATGGAATTLAAATIVDAGSAVTTYTDTGDAATIGSAVTTGTGDTTSQSVTITPASGDGLIGSFSVANAGATTTTPTVIDLSAGESVTDAVATANTALGYNSTTSTYGSTGLMAADVGGNLVITSEQGADSAVAVTDASTLDSASSATSYTPSTATFAEPPTAGSLYTGNIDVAAVGGNSAVSLTLSSGTTLASVVSQLNTAFGTATGHNVASIGGTNDDQLVITGPSGSGDNLDTTGTSLTATAGTSSVATFSPTAATDTLSGQISVGVGSGSDLNYTVAANSTLASVVSGINGTSAFSSAGIVASSNSAGQLILTGPAGGSNTLTFGSTNSLVSTTAPTTTTTTPPSAGVNFTASDVSSLTAASAQTVLTAVTTAISDVAYQRGIIGADVNQLNAAANVASAESVNLTSASSSVESTDYGQATSAMASEQVLSQTGISALAQANSVQQEVLKLLQ